MAYQSIQKGLVKLSADETRIQEDLNAHWEVMAEALQTVMRRYGMAEAYEQLKTLTRGKSFNKEQFLKFVDELPIPDTAKKQLRALTPDRYTGFADILTKKIC